jgi:hypothetical protein
LLDLGCRLRASDWGAPTRHLVAKGDTSEPPERYSAEARKAHIDAFDRAAAQDGYVVVEPPSPELQRHADLNMIALGAKPGGYSVDIPAVISPPEHSAETRMEMTSLVAELEMVRGVGNAFLERLMKVSGERKNLPQEVRRELASGDRNELLRRAGGDEAAVNEQISSVRAMLRSVRGAGAQLAHALADDTSVMGDWYLHRVLATHARGRESFYRSKSQH